MKYRLLATDLDGTVLDGLNLNKAVADAIGQLKNKQVKIVVATGRPLCTALPVARTLGLAEGYIVTFNGAEVYFNERLLYSAMLSHKKLEFIVRQGRKLNASQVVWANGMLYAEQRNEQTLAYQARTPVQCNFVQDLTVLEGASKILWNNSEEEIKRFFAVMRETEGVNCHPSHPLFLEFVDEKASKGRAVSLVAEKLGISSAETVAIGDSFNDLSMIRCAGAGVAMGNAPDEVKAAALDVVADAGNDGFVQMARKYFHVI